MGAWGLSDMGAYRSEAGPGRAADVGILPPAALPAAAATAAAERETSAAGPNGVVAAWR